MEANKHAALNKRLHTHTYKYWGKGGNNQSRIREDNPAGDTQGKGKEPKPENQYAKRCFQQKHQASEKNVHFYALNSWFGLILHELLHQCSVKAISPGLRCKGGPGCFENSLSVIFFLTYRILFNIVIFWSHNHQNVKKWRQVKKKKT